jgi:hypothetical protein
MSNLLQRPTRSMDEIWNKSLDMIAADGYSDLVWLNEMLGLVEILIIEILF